MPSHCWICSATRRGSPTSWHLGDKDHGRAENALDVNDDGIPTRQEHPNVFGMYQPDGIEAGIIEGRTYLFTANEGDARDYQPCFTEEDRVSMSNLNPAKFPESEIIHALEASRDQYSWKDGRCL